MGDRVGDAVGRTRALRRRPPSGYAGEAVHLFVNKARIESDAHAELTWGAAQAGVAAGVAQAVVDEIVFDVEDVLIAAIWVNPAADDAEAVFANNRDATLAALTMGRDGRPSDFDITESAGDVWNPFFRAR